MATDKDRNTMQGFLKPALMTLMMGSVAACSTPQVELAGGNVKKTDGVVSELLENSKQPLPKASTGPISVSNDVWLGGRAARLKRGKPLPSAVEQEGVTLSAYGDQDIQQIADLVQAATGIGVDVTEDAIMYTRGGQDGPVHARTVPVDYTGKLSKFLDQVTGTMGLNWRYEDGRIVVFYLDTHTYVMKMLPSTHTVSMGISGGSSSEGGGSSEQETSSEYEVNLWGEVVEAVTSLVGEVGSVTASRSTGTLSVSAPSPILKRVGTYVEEQNARLAQQVAVNVQVFSVSMSDNSEFGTDFNMSFNDADIGAFGFSSEMNSVTQAGSLGWQLLRPLSGVPDVSGIVRMLNSKGDVSVVTTANATTLNNVPMPIQVGNNRAYVSSVTETEEGTTVGVETVNTGFNMQLLPRITSQGVVALQYNISTSELVGANDGFEQVTITGNTIQLPNINNRAFTQQVMIPDGNTLVLSGFEQTTSRMDKTGTGFADNWLMGGRSSGSMEREVMVITITPVIVDAGKAFERVGE
jgi:type IVB pilus formation R64 PilN family outer membrane protein